MARTFPVLALTGARQTGKTTLLQELFPQHRYVSLDLPSDAEKAERAPELFLREHPGPLLIDEVQYAPTFLRHLKPIVDRDRHRMGQFILTGSQKFSLMKGVSESLAGRIGIASLEGLSRHEIGTASADTALNGVTELLRYLQRGGFPELWRNPELRSEDFFRSYLATYLERDIRQITRVGSLRDFERFVRITAARNAQLLNKSDIAKDVGIAPRTANEWLSVLEASNQIFLLEPYFENTGKRIIKSPKLYWNDTGLLAFLTGMGEGTTAAPAIGSLWESAIYAELRKLNAASGGTRTLWFYRDNEGREVDFLLVGQGRIHFLEAKWGENVDARAAKPLRETAALLKSCSLLETGALWVVARPASSYPLAGLDVEVHGLSDLPSLFGI